jgi:PAS domain S-box-containing protein
MNHLADSGTDRLRAAHGARAHGELLGDGSTQILLLVDHPGQRRRLRQCLASKYAVVTPGDAVLTDAALTDGSCVLCLIDAAALRRLGERVQALRAAAPRSMSFVLVCSRRTLRASGARLAAAVDEVLLAPVDPLEVQVRVAALLRARSSDAEQTRSAVGLRESEQRFRALTENALDLVAIVDIEGIIRYANPAHEQACGFTLPELLGRSAFDFVHPDDVPLLLQIFSEGIVNGQHGGIATYRFRHKDGSWRVVEGVARNLLNDPMVGGVLINSRDITARRQAEGERARLNTAVEQAAEAIIVTSADGTIEYVNPAFEQLTGYTRAEVLGRTTSILKSGRHSSDFFATMWATLQRGEVWSGCIINRRKDGSLFETESVISPVRDTAGRVINYIQITRDVTHERQMEEELRVLNAELEQRVAERTAQLAAANKELETFSYSVSHDLRAPLRAVDGFSRVLLEDYAAHLDPSGRHYLERIRAGARHMGQLIDDLLSLSRVTRAELAYRPVDLSELVQAIAGELVRTQPDRQVTFVIEWGVVVRGDAPLLRVALENLLGNAWKYTSGHARAWIELGALPAAEYLSRCTHRKTEESGHVALSSTDTVYFVRDDGAGFDMTYAGKLFGAFQRLHAASEFEGTGIGLATVQRIIHRHGGRIWAEAAVESGATFYFTLGMPAAPRAPLPQPRCGP